MPSLEDCSSCIWCWAWSQQGRQLGINHEWRGERARTSWNSGLSLPTASVTQVTCRTSWRTSPWSCPCQWSRVQRCWGRRVSGSGRNSGRWLSHAYKLREQDIMCEPPRCLVRHSKCGNNCSFTSTQIPPVVNPNLPSFRRAVLGNKVPTLLSWHSPKPPHKAKRMLISSQPRHPCLTGWGPTIQEPRSHFQGGYFKITMFPLSVSISFYQGKKWKCPICIISAGQFLNVVQKILLIAIAVYWNLPRLRSCPNSPKEKANVPHRVTISILLSGSPAPGLLLMRSVRRPESRFAARASISRGTPLWSDICLTGKMCSRPYCQISNTARELLAAGGKWQPEDSSEQSFRLTRSTATLWKGQDGARLLLLGPSEGPQTARLFRSNWEKSWCYTQIRSTFLVSECEDTGSKGDILPAFQAKPQVQRVPDILPIFCVWMFNSTEEGKSVCY